VPQVPDPSARIVPYLTEMQVSASVTCASTRRSAFSLLCFAAKEAGYGFGVSVPTPSCSVSSGSLNHIYS